MILKKGTHCYISEIGYYNFYYPDFNREIILPKDFVVDNLMWRAYNNHMAVNVISPENELPVTVLWIREDAV